MNTNKNEVNHSPIDISEPQADSNSNKENSLDMDAQCSQYIDDDIKTIVKHDFEKSNIKKKYKKNLIWDGPRWDLAHFDPTMSARERKKLVYYEALFNKLEKNVLKCNEHDSNVKSQNQRKKMRTSISDANSRRELNDLKEAKEDSIDSTGPEIASKSDNTKVDQQEPINSDKIGVLLTPSRNSPCDGDFKTDKSEQPEDYNVESDKITQDSASERECSSIRRPNDWRVKLLNKKCSLQATPYRTATP